LRQEREFMRKPIVLTITILSVLLLSNCEEKGEVTIDDQSVFDFFFIDTVHLNISTIHVDSIITQGTPSLLLGAYDNELLGSITTRSFFQFSLGTGLEVDTEDTFDSLGLIIYPYASTYGTGIDQRIEIYRIEDDYEPEEDFFYQFNNLHFNPIPVGSFILEAEEDEDDSVFVRLSQSLGEEIFQMALDGDDILDSDFDFREYLGGFVMVSVDENAEFINTIPFDENNVKLNMYYRIPIDDDIDEQIYTFPIAAVNNQFTEVQIEETNSVLNQIIDHGELESSETGGMSFIQGSTSLVTKISIPNIEKIEEAFGTFTINNATLEVRLIDGSFDKDTPLPSQLSLYYLSKFENIDQVLVTPPEGRVISGDLFLDDELGLDTFYEFNVGAFLEDMIQTKTLNEESLYLALPLGLASSNIQTLAIDASRFETKLKIYISKYND